MKTLLQSYTQYNRWAYQRIFDTLHQLPTTALETPVVSSFNSIRTTLLHLLDAESIWWQRLKLQEHIQVPSVLFTGTATELEKQILLQAERWADWVNEAPEIQLTHTIHFQDRKGHPQKIQVADMIIHVVNHTSYHRGQLITLLRQQGLTKLPQTDYGFYIQQKR